MEAEVLKTPAVQSAAGQNASVRSTAVKLLGYSSPGHSTAQLYKATEDSKPLIHQWLQDQGMVNLACGSKNLVHLLAMAGSPMGRMGMAVMRGPSSTLHGQSLKPHASILLPSFTEHPRTHS